MKPIASSAGRFLVESQARIHEGCHLFMPDSWADDVLYLPLFFFAEPVQSIGAGCHFHQEFFGLLNHPTGWCGTTPNVNTTPKSDTEHVQKTSMGSWQLPQLPGGSFSGFLFFFFWPPQEISWIPGGRERTHDTGHRLLISLSHLSLSFHSILMYCVKHRCHQ